MRVALLLLCLLPSNAQDPITLLHKAVRAPLPQRPAFVPGEMRASTWLDALIDFGAQRGISIPQTGVNQLLTDNWR